MGGMGERGPRGRAYMYTYNWFTSLCNRNSHNNVKQLCCCVVAQSCPALWDPMDCSPPGSSVHGILQARILEWVVISFPRGSSQPRDWTHISCIGRWILYHWAIWKALLKFMPEQMGKLGFSQAIWLLCHPTYGALCAETLDNLLSVGPVCV